MDCSNLAALVLAAGKGTRMHSDRPKVLRPLLGEPMLGHVYAALAPFFDDRLLTVVGFGAEDVAAAYPERASGFVTQAEQRGTGHAVQVAWPRVAGSGAEYVLVANGDTPLLAWAPLEGFLEAAVQDFQADVAFMTIRPADPAGFGRVVRDGLARPTAIVEAKDFDPARHGQPTGEVNAGIYCLKISTVGPLLERLTDHNAAGEVYLTDLVALADAAKLSVLGYGCGQDPNLLGINTPAELSRAEFTLRKRLTAQWMEAGAVLHQPESVVVGPFVTLAPGCEVSGPCELTGRTRIGAGARVAAFTSLRDAEVGPGAHIREFCHLESARVGEGCIVGPYARLRPGAALEAGARVGNFCELKKAHIGPGSKVNHLSYIGDAEVGPGVNIGAGTITCNYDGKNKYRTTIGQGAFIGSNTALVAPVSVGANALVGAGSVITKDVPEGELAVARGRQVNLKRRNGAS
ncbi:MAG: bifunctional UDP-N-acetylglucosamine diphosphorylase/glucosamine-1-phosphate N-acetyltransferase GlmU [Desulfovibrionaceae bacterium]